MIISYNTHTLPLAPLLSLVKLLSERNNNPPPLLRIENLRVVQPFAPNHDQIPPLLGPNHIPTPIFRPLLACEVPPALGRINN